MLNALFSACTENSSVSNPNVPPVRVNAIRQETSPERLALIGELIVFGTDNFPLDKKDRGFGKGQCALCHMFLPDQRADRSPHLLGIEARSQERVKEERYKMFVEKYSVDGDPDTGIKPHATTGGEYLIESLYCPNCYVVDGSGIKGTNSMQTYMPIANKKHGINSDLLSDFEIVAVVSYMQVKDTPGDYSKVTAIEDWERYFGKKFTFTPEEAAINKHRFPAAKPQPLTSASDNTEQIVEKMVCIACHKIPGLSNAKVGMIGPLLIMKTSAANRIKSPEYQKAVKEGRAHATTPREYVLESITDPGAFIVPGFSDDMIKDYKHKFTLAEFDKLIAYLMEQDAAAAIKDGLDRLPNEKEGSLLIKN